LLILGGTFLAGISTALVSKNINTAYIVGGSFPLQESTIYMSYQALGGSI
jgi:basic membrane lipoprotein Med (substrate-binding protein (PBP1-ABC) superfamily)